MTEVFLQTIEEHRIEGKPLGRHIEHDPRSREHRFVALLPAALQRVTHKRHGGAFNQGDLGSCTGNAAAGAINTDPFYSQHRKLLREADAVALYEVATALDEFPGAYPPDDTGSSGLAVAKAAVQKKYIRAYKHAFGIDEALAALQVAAVITGVNWYEGFDHPDRSGFVSLGGQIRGGHEFEVIGYDPTTDFVEAVNSWGSGWGKVGHFFFTSKTWAELLAQQGDVTILIK